MEIIVLYDGNEESALMSEFKELCLEKGISMKSGDIGHYE